LFPLHNCPITITVKYPPVKKMRTIGTPSNYAYATKHPFQKSTGLSQSCSGEREQVSSVDKMHM